jgi:hypothetical protein
VRTLAFRRCPVSRLTLSMIDTVENFVFVLDRQSGEVLYPDGVNLNNTFVVICKYQDKSG